jgi:hypothetical protein
MHFSADQAVLLPLTVTAYPWPTGSPATRTVLKKAGYNIRPSGQKPQRTPAERNAWLAEMGYAVAQKEIVDPTEADIQEMRAAIGDNGAFAKFSDANKALLFSFMLTLRRKLEVYGENVGFEKELAAEVSKTHGRLSVAADKMREAGWTTAAEARQINDAADILLGIIQAIAAEPKAFNGRTVGSRRKRDEAMTVDNCLKVFKAVVPGVKAKDWRDLEARISCYMSGKEIDPDNLKKRRQRTRRDLGDNT